MLYTIMRADFSPRLLVFGVLALFFAVACVNSALTHQQLAYKKWLAGVCAAVSACFTALFIGVTAPYRVYADLISSVLLLLSAAGAAAALICLIAYIKEKKTTKKRTKINILNYIDDYVLIFDRNGETVFSTCPGELAKSIGFITSETIFETEADGEFFAASFSPITKDGVFLGCVGIFRRITEEKELLTTLSEKSEKLSRINEDLVREVNIDDMLLIAEERRQLSLNIQEEIERKITSLIGQINEFGKETDTEEKIANLTLLADSLRLILADIRKIVYGR